MSKRSCLWVTGLSAGFLVFLILFGTFRLIYGFRKYQRYVEYPSPTKLGSWVTVLRSDGLIDITNINFIKTPHRNDVLFKTKYQPKYGAVVKVLWSRDGSIIVINDECIYDFRNDNEITLPDPAPSAKNQEQINRFLLNRGGSGKQIRYEEIITDETIKPRRHTISLWEQDYWSELDRQ